MGQLLGHISMGKPGKICQNVDTVKQTTQGQSDKNLVGNNNKGKRIPELETVSLRSDISILVP